MPWAARAGRSRRPPAPRRPRSPPTAPSTPAAPRRSMPCAPTAPPAGPPRADSPLAQEKALAVFTLNEPEWSRRMTAQQLQDALDRLAGMDTTKDEVATFTAFVKVERARRAAAR